MSPILRTWRSEVYGTSRKITKSPLKIKAIAMTSRGRMSDSLPIYCPVAPCVGVGPWVPTGRYLFKAIAGQMNNMIVNERAWTQKQGLFYAKRYADHFGIKDGSVPVAREDYYGNEIVGWQFPPKPTDPPADGGPYPT